MPSQARDARKLSTALMDAGHILNTRKYSQDCKKLRGSYIHHMPASGDPDEDEHSMMQEAYFDMWIAFESLFGEPYVEPIWDALVTRWPEALS